MTDFLIKRSDLRDCQWSEHEAAPLADGYARLKVESFAITANNVTYATFGEAMQYWNFFPTNDAEFGRVPVWGFAIVAESKADGVKVGQKVYGYLPISDQFDVQPVNVTANGFVDGAAHRQGLAPIYNTYVNTDADETYSPSTEPQQMLFRPLYLTGWMIDDSLMDATNETPDVVVISSASSKTAIALAHCLSARSGVMTIGLTSQRNRDFVESTGLYSKTFVYEDVQNLQREGKMAFVDFLGRPKLTADVHSILGDALHRSMVIGVTDWETDRTAVEMTGPTPEFFFVPTYAAERAKALGPAALNARLNASLVSFYAASSSFVHPQIEAGKQAIHDAWTKTVDGKIPPSTGLVLSF